MNLIALISIAAVLSQPGAEASRPERSKAPPGVPRVLVMKDLSRRPVRLVSLGPDQLQVATVRGGRSRSSSVPRRDVLAVLADDAAGASVAAGDGAGGWLRTTAGEAIRGTFTPPEKAGAAETVGWKSPRLGDLTVKLDDVRRLEFQPAAAEPGPGKAGEDRVVLANGDVLAGFLEGLGEMVTVEVAKQKREAPLASVARIEMSNAVKPPSGTMVWLTDGEVLRASSIAGSASGATLVRDGQPVSAPASEIAGFVEDAAVLRPLAEFSPTSTAPFGKRAWAGALEYGDSSAPLGAADVTLPSPMIVTWALPAGARRLSARVVLPAACRVWGDCVLIVEQTGEKGVGGKELGRFHLSGEAPEAELNVELLKGGGPVKVTLDEGANGPIQDRVMLRQPLVLLEKK